MKYFISNNFYTIILNAVYIFIVFAFMISKNKKLEKIGIPENKRKKMGIIWLILILKPA
jgi:hypothetical protein